MKVRYILHLTYDALKWHQVASLVRAPVDRGAATCFQHARAVHFSVNDMAHLESGITPSKGGSILFEGGLVHYEVVIVAGGFNIFSEGGILPSEGGKAVYFRSTVFIL